MGFDRTLYGDELVYIQTANGHGSGIRGVQSIDIGFDIPFTNINGAGSHYAGYVLDGNKQSSNFIIDSLVVTEATADPLVYLFDTPFSGALTWEGRDWTFESGFISEYSSSCEVGSIPDVSCSIDVFGNVTSSLPFNTSGKIPDEEIIVAQPGDITLINVTGQETNRIQSYDYKVTINRFDEDFIGGRYRDRIYDVIYPIEVDLSFSMHVDDLEPPVLSGLLCPQNIPDITIQLGNCKREEVIRTFKMEDPILIGLTENSSIGEQLSATVTYKSYVKNIEKLSDLIF